MMKTLIKFLGLALFAGVLFTACSDDDDNDPAPDTCSNQVQDGDEEGVDCGGSCPNACPTTTTLSGTIEEDTTLDATEQYTIDGEVLVASGVTLTIPAGTEIVSNVGSSNYLAVLQGGSIDIQGTSSDPVIMRSNGNAGSWGGLLLCGNATTTAGENATAEVGGLIYGGTDDTDSSGNINYLIIRDAGAVITGDSQFNGLSLYAVGSGTTIANVAIINGTDDGIEFFGGTVNATNIYLENNLDDAIDWTEGWSGTLNTAYVTNTVAGFSTAVEADGVNNNPTINNLTAISSQEGLAIQMKNASGATINGFSATGFSDLFDFPGTSGPAELQIDGADADTADDAVYSSSPTNASLFAWATDAIVGSALPANITGDITLDSAVEYTISGAVLVNSGATLTIPAGTQIVSESGTANYLAVLQGGQINIQGTMANPVEMRSDDGGDWGGLLVCGNATTTAGENVTAEVGGLVYGGSNDTESSGSIEYLILRNTGAQINADSQFNGLSLYAVGSGTMIDNVAVIEGADDGIEFFGGTVNVTNFYAENIEDDAIDWTEGWNGTLDVAYVVNTIENFSTAVEADGVNNNPTISNFTAISSTGGLAIQMKNASGATINGFTATGFDDLFDFPGTSGPAELQIDGADADTGINAAYASSPTNASAFAWATGGLTSEALPANITADTTLDAATVYTISGPVLVNGGATLTIPAGTEIVSASGTANYLAVLQGGQIDIQGTMANPVEMRSDDGDAWGGLLICGNATTTAGENATAEVGGLVYGGTNDTESSGNIDYLILRDTGAQINADSQFNGLTLYAVGSGTTIDNVACIGGSDDGIEFFGGTVNVTGFYAEDLEDDSVDWTEGWNGTLADTFVKHTLPGFSTAIEADGVNENPTLTNFTAISTVGGVGIQMKNASGATITGLTLTGYANQFDFTGTSGPAELQVDGADANEAAAYTSSTIVEADFAWIGN
ncbi:hypothetical protein L0P88_12610 [Muricauda sp. SCSIO 64092]|uniref:beta strand repeat-containing protein n=1 Tax=Allomuricauda sp. SCSIO 64092 TaxID=2908842 RepID=UPI001FF64696|nr:hypothetical protein [Muricauda sp. SCSIO 64092]UOY04799.1 hypothetical protein L0P88_12610 [Muricauda sp. SCSIO 64092]